MSHMPLAVPDPTSTVLIDRSRPGVIAVALNRPGKRNALDRDVVRRLGEAVRAADARAIVLHSADPSCFCAGADLDLPDAERARLSDELYELYELMLTVDVPIIAALDGIAVGGGAQLAVAADLRIGGPGAAFRFAGPGHGLAVGAWGLPSLVGRGRAADLCLSMRTVPAREALAMGLLDRVEDDPVAAAVELGDRLAALDTGAVSRVKRIIRDGSGLLAALHAERAGNASWSGAIPSARGSRDD
jgi:enoyl-CoA hydratase/carnithine racemase